MLLLLLLLLFCLVRFFGVAPRFFGGGLQVSLPFFQDSCALISFQIIIIVIMIYLSLLSSFPSCFMSLLSSHFSFSFSYFFSFSERERERERDSLGCFQDSWKSLRVRQGQFQEGTQPISSKKKSLSREGVGFSGMLEDP